MRITDAPVWTRSSYFKIVLIHHLYGIPSLRRTMQEIWNGGNMCMMNITIVWFARNIMSCITQQPTARDTGYTKVGAISAFAKNVRAVPDAPKVRVVRKSNQACMAKLLERAEDIRHIPKYKELYRKRKEPILCLTHRMGFLTGCSKLIVYYFNL